MELRIFTEPQQGATYDQLLEVANTAEACGFDAFFRSDHYLRIGGGDPGPGPTDAWITLAGLARETTRIRLGTLMTAATFRLPGPLAVSVAQVDAMSRGRVELGIGAAWYDSEHHAFGIPFHESFSERFERLEEQLEIITGIWAASPEKPFSYEGRHYSIQSNPGLPRTAQQPRPPIIVGGGGTRRTPEIAARFADEFNAPFSSVDTCRVLFGALDEACERIGRDKASIGRSVALTVCCGEDDAQVRTRAEAIGQGVDQLKASGAAGTPKEVVERLLAYSSVGVSRIYLQVLDLSDLDHVRLIASEVYPAVRGV